MTPTVESLFQAALALPEDDRAERLLDSLPTEIPSQLHPAWREEFHRRANQVDSGAVRPVSWEEVRRQAWEALDYQQEQT